MTVAEVNKLRRMCFAGSNDIVIMEVAMVIR
jgi:hypothetical protein